MKSKRLLFLVAIGVVSTLARAEVPLRNRRRNVVGVSSNHSGESI